MLTTTATEQSLPRTAGLSGAPVAAASGRSPRRRAGVGMSVTY